jgi:hypothetical protein
VQARAQGSRRTLLLPFPRSGTFARRGDSKDEPLGRASERAKQVIAVKQVRLMPQGGLKARGLSSPPLLFPSRHIRPWA